MEDRERGRGCSECNFSGVWNSPTKGQIPCPHCNRPTVIEGEPSKRRLDKPARKPPR